MCRSTCFGRPHAHHHELSAALTASGFTLERGGSSVVGRGLAEPARPRTTTKLLPAPAGSNLGEHYQIL
jgi:hypothetical protein